MKVLIADDHPIFRKGLKDVLENAFQKIKAIECDNGTEAMYVIREDVPEIAILDINMPGMSGLEVAKQALKEKIRTRIIILTMYKEKEMIRKSLLYGVSGYVLKDFAETEIVECLNKVINGGKFIGKALKASFSDLDVDDKRKMEMIDFLKCLTQSELKTLKLVNQNKTTKEISELLFLSEKTIENYRSRICQKLNLPPRNNSLILWINENRDVLASINEF